MTSHQLLAGALGLASWRARAHVEEFGDAAKAGSRLTTRGKPSDAGFRPTVEKRTSRLLPSELGVTDAVLATIWGFGPTGMAYDVAPWAERHFTGADIAFVDTLTRRILLYQAKVATLTGQHLRLKSEIPPHQRAQLTAKVPLLIDGSSYSMTGRVAMYQDGYGDPWWGPERSYAGWRQVALDGLGGAPRAGLLQESAAQQYYMTVMACGDVSPCGVMAGRIGPGSVGMARLPLRATWPWEYDAYMWFMGLPNPLEDGRRNASTTWPAMNAFESDDRAASVPVEERLGDVSEFAAQLRQTIGSDYSRHVHVIAL